MITRDEALVEKRIREAKARRVKKPMCKELNISSIRDFLEKMSSDGDEVTYAIQNDNVLVDVINGNPEEAFEFRTAFSSLSADCYRFYEDLQNVWIPECFDLFFAAIYSVEMSGYDVYEEDYFPLNDFEASEATMIAREKLMTMKKNDIVEAAERCFNIAMQYVALRSRFEDLKAGLDIIKAKNDGLLGEIQQINDLYDKAIEKRISTWDGVFLDGKEGERFESLVNHLPAECWVR